MGVVGPFEVEVIVGDKPMRELVDSATDRRYIIGHQGQEFQVQLTNKWDRSVAYLIVICGTQMKHSVVLHPHQKYIYQNYISTTEVSPFLLSVPVLQRVEQSGTGNNKDLSSVPTIEVKIYSVAKRENPAHCILDFSTGNLDAVTSTNNKKVSAPLVVTNGAPKKATVGIAAMSDYTSIAVISAIQLWARSSTSLYVDGILAKCWPSMFVDWGKERPKLCVPSFSCGFRSVAMDTFSPRENIKDEQQALDKTLKRCGLHLKQEALMTLAETLSCVLCGTKSQHGFITKKFMMASSNKMLQLFSNYFGVPIFVYQYNDKNTNNNDPAPQKLVVYETQPSEESKIWPVGNKWVPVELHDFIDLDDIDDDEEENKKKEEEERLNTIRTRLEELKRQEAERLKQMEELRQQEEDIIKANPAKKIKIEKK